VRCFIARIPACSGWGLGVLGGVPGVPGGVPGVPGGVPGVPGVPGGVPAFTDTLYIKCCQCLSESWRGVEFS
jgi:hypothetical protein